MPAPEKYIVSKPLANFVVGYQNSDLIAEQLFPVKPVDEPKGFYWAYGKEVFTAEDDYRADRSRANAVDHDFTTVQYQTREHALNHDVSWKERDAATKTGAPFRPYRRAATVVSAKLMLGREITIANMVRATANITQNATLSGTSQWSDYSGTSDPLLNIRTGRNAIRASTGSLRGLLAVVPYSVFEILTYHPKVLDKMSTAGAKILSQDLLAQLMRVDKVIIPESIQNTANPGQTPVMADVWGKDVLLARVDTTDLDMQVTLGRIFRLNWESTGGMQAEARRWTEADRKTDVVEAAFEEDKRFIATDAAYLIKNAIA